MSFGKGLENEPDRLRDDIAGLAVEMQHGTASELDHTAHHRLLSLTC
jgi:hypothetical protein